ncbi:hypothetical protein [Amycolatopsis acidicola]|uniref:hypothetical protein n=1 Tax=Amycolatopsis acidicola TaxID=2596893 RepID=UPI0014077A1A|nr:hypothetical protein [Amycolatopsis acidicola]
MPSDELIRDRVEVLRALVLAAGHRHELLEALWQVSDDGEARAAVQRVLGVTEEQALAVLDLQLRRFTPAQVAALRTELAELETAGQPDPPAP